MSTKESKLLTLQEVGRRAGVSMPTMQRYKNEFADRIPSEGEGRTQRYPEVAVEIVKEIKAEMMLKRGRPRKDGTAPSAAATRKARKPSNGKTRTTKPVTGNGGENAVLRRLARIENELAALTALMKQPLKISRARQ